MTNTTNHKAPYQHAMILCVLLLCAIALGSVDTFAQLPVRTRSLQLLSNNNVNIIEHRAPNGIVSNFTYTWPSAYPVSPTDNFLTSDGAGVLSWANYDNLFWRLGGNATATAASFVGPTTANTPLNLATSNAIPGSIDYYIGTVAPANRRITLNNTSFDVGTIANPVAINLAGALNVEGTVLINTVGTSNTTIGNAGAGASTITLNAGASGDIVLVGVDADAVPTDYLTITAGNQVRRSALSGSALEGIVFSAGAYRLGGTGNAANPFLVNRYINMDASNLSFTSNGGASTTMLLTGGANSGVAMTTAGTGSIALTGPTSVTGNTTVNTTGSATTTIGNVVTGGAVDLRSSGANPITIDVGVNTNNLVFNNIAVDGAPAEFLTINASNQVRRSVVVGPGAQEGITFTLNAYRLGGVAVTDNPFLVNRFVNIDGSNLSFTANGGVSTPLLVTGGANSGVAMTTAGTGTITMTGPTDVTGATTINSTGTANTTIGNTGVGATSITLNAGTTGNIVLGGVDADAAPTEILTITATNEVRRSTLGATALEGVVFTSGAYRLGGINATTNPFLSNRFVNIDASNLSFTSNGGASTTMLLTGGANSGVAMTTAGTGTITMAGPTDVTGATTINTSGTANTTIGNTGVGATTVALNAGTTGNIVLGGVDADAAPTEILTITATNEVRRSTLGATALEGVVFTSGAYRLGGINATTNPFLTNRFVNIDASNLSFTSDGGASTTMLLTGGANSGIAMTTAGTGTIGLTGTTNINTAGTAVTTIGNITTGGAVAIRSSGVNPITLDVGVNTNNLVFNNIATDAAPTELLSITAGNQVRRTTLTGTALEGIVFSAGAYRLGGTTNAANPFLTNRFVNIDASNLSFTSSGGASTTMLLTGGANSGVAMTTAGTGTIGLTGTTNVNTAGTAVTTIGNITTGGAVAIRSSGVNPITLDVGVNTNNLVFNNIATDAAPTELLSITASNQVRRTTLTGTALEGVVFSAGAYRLGGTTNAANPFLASRFVNIDASNLSFTSNGGASTTVLITGGANSGVAMTTAGTGTIGLTGTTNVNITGTANTTIGNTAVGATTITLNAGTTGNIVLGGVDADAAPTEFLSITAGNLVRRTTLTGTAREGIVFSAGAYRLGGTTNVANPFLASRFVNLNASNLSFTSNGGASTTMLLTGGANSGVTMTTAGTGTIGLTGTTNVNTTGTANTTIGNTGVGATTVTLNAGTTGDIVLGGVDTDAAPTELLSITAGNLVRRTTLSGTALEGLVFSAGAYRLGGTTNAANPFLTSRFVNIDASNLSFTSNGGASTTMLLTGGANSGVAMTTAGTGTITMTGPTSVTGATTINTTGTANTTIGNTGVGATTVTLNAGTTGDIVLGGVDTDAAPTELLSITAGNLVRRTTLSGTALEGLVFSAGAYRLGGTTNAANPFLANRFVNIDASNLSFTSNGGASTTMLLTGGANSGVAMTTAGTGTITMTGPTSVTGATTINTTGTANTTIGNIGVGATTVTLNAGTTGNIVLGGVVTDATPTEILTITATNEVRRSTLSGTALEGIVFSAGAYRLGGTTNAANPFLTNRFVNIDASNLSFTSDGGASTTMLITGGANSGVAMTTAGTGTITMTGPTDVTGATTINSTGTANTTIGNTGVGATSITLNAGTTGNIVLGGVDADAAPTEILTITATNEVRRSTLGATALEGVVFTSGAYRLGGINATTNPFLTNRFVNIDASNLSFTSNGGASTTMLLTGGANSGVAMTTAGTGTITMTGPTDVTGATTINTAGTANTTIGNTGVGATTVTLNAGTTGNIVLGGVDADAAPTEILTITATNEVRRSTLGGTALEGLVFSSGAYRLGGTTNVANPFLTSRFVNIDASNLSFTSNGGASTTMLLTGGANSGVAMTTAGTGTITMTGPTDVTGATTINTTGTANTTIGNTGVGATTVTLNAGTTGNIVLGGVDADAAPTEILTITATNEVRRSTLSGTALEGLVFSAGAYRLGGTTNVANPFLTSRFVNIDASNLSFTSNGGASTTMLITGGANSGVAMTTAGTGTIGLTGTTNVNTTGAAATTIGNIATGGAVDVRSSGVNPITLDVGVNTNNLVLNNIAADATPTEILTINGTNQVRRSTLAGTALEGLVFSAGAYRLGGTTNVANPFLTSRFVNIDASNLSFTSNGGASTTMLITGGANSGVAMTTAGTGTITMTGPTSVTGATTINTTGTANTTIGNTGVGATTVTLNAGTTGNIVLGGVVTDATPAEILTITATNEVRRSTLTGTALEGVTYTAGAYRLGGALATDNPFLVNRFVNLNASNLTFSANGGVNQPLSITGGVNNSVTVAPAGTGIFEVSGTPGVENIRAGSLSANSPDVVVAEGIVTADNTGDVRRRSAADALQILGIGKGIFTPGAAGATHVISTGAFDLIAGATVNVTVFGPTGAAVHAMITNINAAANQFTVVTSATVDATFSLHWMIINP